MADYREISQAYAQGAIKAALLINGAAAIALLAQAPNLASYGIGEEIGLSLTLWTGGVTIAALTWVLGFLSTRYVDKGIVEGSAAHMATSDRLMLFGVVMVVLSMACFATGCLLMAEAYQRAFT